MLKIKPADMCSGPMVTAGFPVYNGEKHLAEAIESVLNQDFEDIELVISDNGSDDKTPDICRNYVSKDRRIKYYRYPKNLGYKKNLWRTVDVASGKYFMYVAADDLREETMISECLPVLEQDQSVVICYSQTKHIDENGKLLGLAANDYVKADQELPKERFLNILWNLDICNVFYGLIRMDALHQSSWPSVISQGPDHVLLSQLALLGKFIQIPKPLFIRRSYPEDRKFASLEEYNSFRAGYNPENDYEGITLPFCEFALETLNAVKLADLNETDRGELVEAVLRCFRNRWGDQVIYEINRSIGLIQQGDFRRAWGKSISVRGDKITEQFYISTILNRLEIALFIFPEIKGLHYARALCLQKLGRHREAKAVASIEMERNPENSHVKKLVQSL